MKSVFPPVEPKRADHFYESRRKEPHRDFTKELVRRHPEVREWIGKKNPWTAAIAAAVVGLQFSIAALIGASGSWWAAVGLAFFVGTLLNQTLIGVVHEASHNLMFRSHAANKLAGILANTAMLIPSSVSFGKYHLKHHAFQGVHELDADMPSRLEARLVRNVWWRKTLWLLFYPIWQILRTARVRDVSFLDAWVVLNLVVVFAVDAAVYVYLGPVAFLYVALSFWFCFGLSISGARLIQEHFIIAPPQETYSYYGWAAPFALYVTYHNEHHDFPSATWNNLPKIRKLMPEHYDSLVSHSSYTKLLLRFLFSKNMSLFDRVERDDRGTVGINDPVEPDLDFADAPGSTPASSHSASAA